MSRCYPDENGEVKRICQLYKQFNMIEIFNTERTESFGRFENFKSAKGTLNSLIASGKLTGEIPAVLVCSYKNNEIQREYVATYHGKWRVPKLPKVPLAATKVGETARRAKKHWCKIYKSPVECFKEGFPDWMNRVYQPVN